MTSKTEAIIDVKNWAVEKIVLEGSFMENINYITASHSLGDALRSESGRLCIFPMQPP